MRVRDSAGGVFLYLTKLKYAVRSGLEQNGDFKVSCSQYEEFLLTNGFTFTHKKIGPLNQNDVGGVYVYQAW